MFCPNCGKPVAEGSKFCPNCGSQLVAPVEAPEQDHPQIIMEANGVKFDAVQVVFETKLFSKTGLTATSETVNRIREITGCGIWQANKLASEMQRNNELKQISTQHLREEIAQKEKIADEDIDVRCPKCFSKNVKTYEVGYSAMKGLIGGVLTGGVGLIAGFHGRHKMKAKCMKCGYEWKL